MHYLFSVWTDSISRQFNCSTFKRECCTYLHRQYRVYDNFEYLQSIYDNFKLLYCNPYGHWTHPIFIIRCYMIGMVSMYFHKLGTFCQVHILKLSDRICHDMKFHSWLVKQVCRIFAQEIISILILQCTQVIEFIRYLMIPT